MPTEPVDKTVNELGLVPACNKAMGLVLPIPILPNVPILKLPLYQLPDNPLMPVARIASGSVSVMLPEPCVCPGSAPEVTFVPVRIFPAIVPLASILPIISNFWVGLVVLIPTLPLSKITNLSAGAESAIFKIKVDPVPDWILKNARGEVAPIPIRLPNRLSVSPVAKTAPVRASPTDCISPVPVAQSSVVEFVSCNP